MQWLVFSLMELPQCTFFHDEYYILNLLTVPFIP